MAQISSWLNHDAAVAPVSPMVNACRSKREEHSHSTRYKIEVKAPVQNIDAKEGKEHDLL